MNKENYIEIFKFIISDLESKYNHTYILNGSQNLIKHDNDLFEFNIICEKCKTKFILDLSTQKDKFQTWYKINNIYYQYWLYDSDDSNDIINNILEMSCNQLIIKGILE